MYKGGYRDTLCFFDIRDVQVLFDLTRLSIGPSLVGMVDPTTQGCLHTHDEWMLFVASQDNPLFGSCLLDLCDHYIITCTDSNRQLARLCITLPKFNNMETENIYQPPAIPPAFPGPELCSSTATSTTSVPTPAAPPTPVADMHWQPYHFIAPAPEETPLPAAWPEAPPEEAA